MLPTVILATGPEADRARWKIVRRDTMAEVDGLIMRADVASGECVLAGADGSSVTHQFGADGFRIVPRR